MKWQILTLFHIFILTVKGQSGHGVCSWYGAPGEIPPGSFTSCGNFFDRTAMTAAQLDGIDPKLPCGTVVTVSNSVTGVSVNVTLNDHGGGISGRVLDLTETAFDRIANDAVGIINCSYSVLQLGPQLGGSYEEYDNLL